MRCLGQELILLNYRRETRGGSYLRGCPGSRLPPPAAPMNRQLPGGNCQSPAKEGALFSESLRTHHKPESRFGKQADQTVRENESQSQWGERVDEAAGCLCLPETSWLPPTSTADRHRGGHLALWVFWAQGGSPETGAWEVPSTTGGGAWSAHALSFTLPAPAASH